VHAQCLLHAPGLSTSSNRLLYCLQLSLQVTTESVVLGESSPSLDDAGRHLVDVIVGILRSACHYSDFNMSHSDVIPKHAASAGASAGPRNDKNEFFDEPAKDAPRKSQVLDQPKETESRVLFNPSLVGRLGIIARKLLEVVEMIRKSSSAELAQLTEQWRIQWHVEAYMFIINRTERRDTRTFYSLAACNRRDPPTPGRHPPPHTLPLQHLLRCGQRRAAPCTVLATRPRPAVH
jgi:hypothetical protein